MSFYRVIDDIKTSLYNQGYDANDVEDACEEAAEELSASIADLVANALYDAESAGLQAGMKDFVAELTAIQSGDDFVITTHSGRKDFSSPERKMLNSLLKNAKVAKDGHLYKRIPIRDKSSPTSSVDVDRRRQSQLEGLKAKISADIGRGGVGRDIGKTARDFASSFAATRAESKPVASKERSSTIRTVSSNQDANTDWVVPAKHKDASSILDEVNARLIDGISHTLRDIYERYTR